MAPRLLHRVILMKKLPAHSSCTVLSRPRRRALRYWLESGSADAACVPFQAKRSFYARKAPLQVYGWQNGHSRHCALAACARCAPGMDSSTRSATHALSHVRRDRAVMLNSNRFKTPHRPARAALAETRRWYRELQLCATIVR